jgi:hypothetical protein
VLESSAWLPPETLLDKLLEKTKKLGMLAAARM